MAARLARTNADAHGVQGGLGGGNVGGVGGGNVGGVGSGSAAGSAPAPDDLHVSREGRGWRLARGRKLSDASVTTF